MRDLPLIVLAAVLVWLLFAAAHGARNITTTDLDGRDPCVLTTCRPVSP